ncbi:hypothetical protein FRB93_006462 [Tulasnella sp. JGI-2019a]|nr:hypothetical protein FRB93_006462 [Tulasnella sp. JGI-2019a]
MIWAWRKWTPEGEQTFWTFFSAASSQLHLLWGYRSNVIQAIAAALHPNPHALQCLEILTRQTKSFGKAFSRMQRYSISRFVKLPGCNTLVLSFWRKVVEAANAPPDLVTDEFMSIHPVHLVVQSMAIFKESLAQWSPKKAGPVIEMDAPIGACYRVTIRRRDLHYHPAIWRSFQGNSSLRRYRFLLHASYL